MEETEQICTYLVEANTIESFTWKLDVFTNGKGSW